LFKLMNENALYVEFSCEHTYRYRSWTYQLKVTTQTKAVGQSMVYRQIADCIIQNGIPCKGARKEEVVSVFNNATGTKGPLDYVFCKAMFVEIAAVGTKSSMIDTCLKITFVIEQRYVLATSAWQTFEIV